MTNLQAEQLLNNLSSMLDVKGIVGYKIARNVRMIQEELKEYAYFKEELFHKYGKQDGDKLIINKDSENYHLFIKEMTPIENQEVHFDFRKITEEELENSDLNAQQMIILMEYFMEV